MFDRDCCEKCYAQIDRQHPGHALAALHEPTDLIRRREGSSSGSSNSFFDINPSTRHFAIHCDGCNKPISGIRYKCAHSSCPDFDLCATCEADPISYATNKKIGHHSFRDHLMVKIRKPIAVAGSTGSFGRFSSAGINANRVRLDRAIDNIRKAFPSVSTSSNSFTSPTSTAQTGASTKAAEIPINTNTANVKTSTNDDKTWIIDVPLPFAIQGGQKDIHLSFDLGKNEKGETVILTKDGKPFDATVMDTIMKEIGALSSNNDDKANAGNVKATTVTVEDEELDKKDTVKPVQGQQQSQMKDARLEYDARWMNVSCYCIRMAFDLLWLKADVVLFTSLNNLGCHL